MLKREFDMMLSVIPDDISVFIDGLLEAHTNFLKWRCKFLGAYNYLEQNKNVRCK